ncbi:hypothetical protein NHX12_008307 [Muraenolepis orangiensis]|uniref:Uncharacterized protein n=1 Tax=Muraenolepis orangiensis TaxID=630683 RepID=A0A9Q0DKI0_9TELE|nr:hypothetical protein NHX12_008307 [Muraenolepis orangiensis]
MWEVLVNKSNNTLCRLINRLFGLLIVLPGIAFHLIGVRAPVVLHRHHHCYHAASSVCRSGHVTPRDWQRTADLWLTQADGRPISDHTHSLPGVEVCPTS